MYIKGENEFFFLTHFTEYNTKVTACENEMKCIEICTGMQWNSVRNAY